MSKSALVVRHNRVVRATHWTIALSALLLIFSGFGEMPMYARYGLTQVPGFRWSGNYEINLILHYIAAFFFTAAVVFHMIYHAMRREFAALPRRGDVTESVHIIWAMIRGKEEPQHGKFLAEQRLAYAAMGLVSLILVLTGLIKTYKNMGNIILDPMFLQVVTYVHTIAAMPFVLLLLAHLGAFLVKANWPLFPSMFSGRVSREYARRRHGKWDIESQ
ncbi:cytochrome b/b6 domain-containing protein [Desulfurispirillum indicum]|uniref:formate dehydrogenase subunit gamma n=1 Tax=Desulfurispirillum indicum TaxID=936456 RepID=UPI001CF98B76|nr:cytochrome b/b6 domain-containing protein [Desulfurispirillum indicum]UCZ55614.1 cytochrome b/b6 domain-containing protein [Desulfurispirillum indicum]